MTQLQAGFILDIVKNALENEYPSTEVNGLLSQLSYFDIEVYSTIHRVNNEMQEILCVAHNIISRGLPTKPSLWVENKILQAYEITKQDQKNLEIGTIKHDFITENKFVETLYKSLHVIDPTINDTSIAKRKINTWENLGSSFEEDFLYTQLPKCAGQFWVQIIETQRELESILRFSATAKDEIEKFINGTIQIFNDQRLDFSLEYPYPINGQRGFVLEIDGSQHDEHKQQIIDNNRDEAIKRAKWNNTIRIKTRDWKLVYEKTTPIRQLASEQYFSILKQNFEQPIYNEQEGVAALEFSLIPFAIARIQKTIIHLLFEGHLNLNESEWNVAVIEKDIPCGKLAFEDLEILFSSLLDLKGEKVNLPKLNLFVENNNRFDCSKLKWANQIDRNIHYHLFIDISVLQRSGLVPIDSTVKAETSVLIRSTHSPKTSRTFKTGKLIPYKPLGARNLQKNVFIEDDLQVKKLEYFLQNIFRKTDFRPGQVEIINRAIQTKSVIGLLPTGTGKSLTYQLTALLQPGITIIIDPIKSLMKDQFEGLLKNGIDGAIYINSSLNHYERKIALEKIKNAQTLFAFVSPERLQDTTFRKELLETSQLNNHYFSYCVIDEAHCVSEWGHDFRTSYLRLGDNARKYCLSKDREHIPFFALTATASYDVLSDIQRELEIPEETAIVRLEKSDRPELQFKIVQIVADIDPKKGLNDWSNKQALGEAKQFALAHQLSVIPDYYKIFSNNEQILEEGRKAFNGIDIRLENFDPTTFYDKQGKESNAGLIFCPHRNWYFGVTDNAANLQQKFEKLKIGTFLGSDGVHERDTENEKSQSGFVNHHLDLLVATKAFGMGIDKPNIRFVTHFNYPSSIESYYQEAGRGGRDRKLALGLILFNKQEINTFEKIETVTEDGDLAETIEHRTVSIDKDILLTFHRNNFKGISKEKHLLSELLIEIKFPSHKFTNQIEEKVFEEFGIPIRLKAETNTTGRQVLYINQNIGSIYLDRDNLPFYIHTEAIPNAAQIGNFIKNFIMTEKPVNMTGYNWLSQHTQSSSQAGIEKLLEDKNTNSDFHVIIPFTNNGIERIAKYLLDNQLRFTEIIVRDAQDFCHDKDVFINNLETQYKKAFNERISIPENLIPTIKNLFVQIRNEGDTFKAIYRLSIIGVVEDYTIDYNSKTITAHISKKPQGYYTVKLRQYLLQYNSEEKTNEKLERLPFYKGNTEIQKCLGFLIKFVYEETAIQRKAAIDAMEQACEMGLQENGSQEFKIFIDLYMNSKYARKQWLPDDTEKGLKAEFWVVEKYMNLMSTDVGQINNFKHLRGATTRLLVQRPDNFVFILLKSFSVLLIETKNKSEYFVTEAKKDFYDGFLKLSEATKDDILSIKLQVDKFKERISIFDTEALEHIEDMESSLYLTLHLNWLNKFNNKFTETHA